MARHVVLGGLLVLVWAAGASGQSSLTINRIIHVDATGTSTQNCTALRDVLAGLTGRTSETEAYHVKLEPGVYACGTNTVSVPTYVTIEGSGISTTSITGRPDSADTGIFDIDHASNAELRWLRIHHWSDTQDAVVISVDSSSNVRFDHIDVFTFGSGQTRIGLLAEGGPLFEEQAVVTVRDSYIASSQHAILTKVTGTGNARVWVFDSQVDGSVDTSQGGDAICVGSYEASPLPLDVNCDPPP